MKKEIYKNFAQKFGKFKIDDYVNYIIKDENGNIRLEIFTSTKREYEERVVFIFGKDFCVFENDYVKFDISEEWKKYLKEIQLQKNKTNANKTEILREFCKKVNTYGFFGLKMPTYLLDGQEISTFEFFKRELEKMCGRKLKYIRYTSPFKEKDNIYENYDTFQVVKTVEYEFLMPESAFDIICNDNEEMTLKKYESMIKNDKYVFVLNRHLLSGEFREDWNFDTKYDRTFYLCFDTSGKSLLLDDLYKKDKKYDEIILKTLSYYAKSKNKALNINNLDNEREI